MLYNQLNQLFCLWYVVIMHDKVSCYKKTIDEVQVNKCWHKIAMAQIQHLHTATSCMEWWNLGSLLLLARSEQQTNHSNSACQPRTNQINQICTTIHFYSGPGPDSISSSRPHAVWNNGILTIRSCLPDPSHKKTIALLHINQKQTR